MIYKMNIFKFKKNNGGQLSDQYRQNSRIGLIKSDLYTSCA